MPSGFRLDVDSWLAEFEEVKAMAQEIIQIIQERNIDFPMGGPEASRRTATARRKIGSLGTHLERMLKWLDSAEAAELSELERNRRRDLLYDLRNRREQMQLAIKRTQAGTADRDALFASGTIKSVAVSGPATGRETERSAGQDAAGLLQLQQQVMRQQDDDLTSMERTIHSTKHIALAIGEEVDLQTRLLEELDEDVNVTQSRLQAASRRIRHVLETSSTWRFGCVMFVLIVAMVLLTLITLKMVRLFRTG